MQPERPDTPASKPDAPAAEAPLPVADLLPVAEPVRPARRRRDPEKAAREAARTRLLVRLGLFSIALVLGAVFTAAFRIYPYDEDGRPRSMSTHTQLGLPPCNFVALSGKPCPSCGMTTSFALLVRGDVSASLRANWVGTIICVLWALTLVWSVASGIRGKPLLVPVRRGELVLTAVVGVVVALMLVRWAVILLV